MAKARSKAITLPDVLLVLPIRETVVYPMAITPVLVGHERSIRLVEDVMAVNRFVALVTQREATVPAAGPG